MSPSYQQQIMAFCNGKDARTMHKVLLDFNKEGYSLADLTLTQFNKIMRKLIRAHKKFQYEETYGPR